MRSIHRDKFGAADFPKIICLCGSTRFSKEFKEVNERESLNGNIVISVGVMCHEYEGMNLTEEAKVMLDELHLRKIDLADEVLFLNVGGYIGLSTSRELIYSREQGKTIRFLEE